MPRYVFRCSECPATETVVQSIHEPTPAPAVCVHGPMVRDYRAEAAGVSGLSVIRQERESDHTDFLPTPKDFLRQAQGNEFKAERLQKEWNESHEPRGHNSGKYRPGYGANQ